MQFQSRDMVLWDVAQGLERFAISEKVGGSIPLIPTMQPNKKVRHHVTRLNNDTLIVLNILSWCFGGRGTPVLIPNTAVKSSCADGTYLFRESR